jgi:hypothetical protein
VWPGALLQACLGIRKLKRLCNIRDREHELPEKPSSPINKSWHGLNMDGPLQATHDALLALQDVPYMVVTGHLLRDVTPQSVRIVLPAWLLLCVSSERNQEISQYPTQVQHEHGERNFTRPA